LKLVSSAVLGAALASKADLSTHIAGNVDYGPFNGCGCTCPPGSTPIGCYCDAANTNRWVQSSGTIGYSAAVVSARAFSDYGLLKGEVAVDASHAVVGTDFGCDANFSDWITPTIPGFSGLTQAVVKITFRIKGERSGSTLATGGYNINHALTPDSKVTFTSVPADDTETVSGLVQIGLGNGFGIEGNISLKAADCHSILSGHADYASRDDYGLRMTQFGFFTTNGIPLPNVRAVGSSGTVYRLGPSVAISVSIAGSKQLQITGFPNSNYVTEATLTLNGPTASPWASINTNTADGTGLITIDIADPAPPDLQFFRVRMQ